MKYPIVCFFYIVIISTQFVANTAYYASSIVSRVSNTGIVLEEYQTTESMRISNILTKNRNIIRAVEESPLYTTLFELFIASLAQRRNNTVFFHQLSLREQKDIKWQIAVEYIRLMCYMFSKTPLYKKYYVSRDISRLTAAITINQQDDPSTYTMVDTLKSCLRMLKKMDGWLPTIYTTHTDNHQLLYNTPPLYIGFRSYSQDELQSNGLEIVINTRESRKVFESYEHDHYVIQNAHLKQHPNDKRYAHLESISTTLLSTAAVGYFGIAFLCACAISALAVAPTQYGLTLSIGGGLLLVDITFIVVIHSIMKVIDGKKQHLLYHVQEDNSYNLATIAACLLTARSSHAQYSNDIHALLDETMM